MKDLKIITPTLEEQQVRKMENFHSNANEAALFETFQLEEANLAMITD